MCHLAVFKKDPMKKERKLKPFQIIESGFTEEDNAALLTLEIEPDPRDPLKVKIDGTVYPVWVAQKEIKRLINWLEKAAAQ